ncbi:MAG: Hsp33 family molecular chaperone HslO [Planctomycetes bacterium]|nr:Hsp33 family molecular chaperone HslO [Planctomycetota bacterium]
MTDPSDIEHADRVLRAMTGDSAFRIILADTTDTVGAVLAAQEVPIHSLVEVAEIVTSAVLIRETMAPGNRVQVVYLDPFDSQLVGDAFPEGRTRGLARIQDDVLGVQPGDGGSYLVERALPSGGSHRGHLRTGPGESLVRSLQGYFLQSEQITSMVDLACVVRDGAVAAAAGYVVQLLPELTEPPLMAMAERLRRFGSLYDRVAESGADPQRLLAMLLDGAEYTVLSESPVSFHCPCNRDRVRSAAAALGREDLEGLLQRGEELAVSCDYCRERYMLGPEDYRVILGAH